MAIYATDNVPAVSFKTLSGVIGEPALNVTIDRNTVVIIERSQFAQLQGTRQRANFVRDAFHHAAITQERIGVVIHDIVTRTVKLRGQSTFSNCHTHRIRDALTQWASGGFYAWGIAVFWVTWSFRMQLTEVFQLGDWQVIASEVQQAINQHRAMAVRKHKAVTIGPIWIGRVVIHVIAPQDFRDISHTHRGTWMTRIGFLHSVHTECTDRIGKLFTRGHVLLQVGFKETGFGVFSQTTYENSNP